MIEFEKDRFRKRAPSLLEALKKRGFDACFFETVSEAREFIESRISKEETVGIGGSVTIREKLGICDVLEEKAMLSSSYRSSIS